MDSLLGRSLHNYRIASSLAIGDSGSAGMTRAGKRIGHGNDGELDGVREGWPMGMWGGLGGLVGVGFFGAISAQVVQLLTKEIAALLGG